LDHTITELQAQIDQLSLALHQWRSTQDHLEPMEQRLTELTERCAEILTRWTATDARHAQAVGQVEARLHDWSNIEARLQQDAVQRLRELEVTIENEWKALRQMHEEPIRQLREQAAALGETCRTAASLALQSFEKAETRIAALEADLQGRLTKISNDVAALAARPDASRQGVLPPAGAAPFPLDGIMRIHDELRHESSAPAGALPPAAPPEAALAAADAPTLPLPAASVAAGAPAPPTALSPRAPAETSLAPITQRLETLEREVTTEREEVREAASRAARMRWQWRVLLAALIVAMLVGGAYAIQLQRRFSRELDAAATRAEAAERDAAAVSAAAAKQIADTRAAAERQIAEARETARQAQITSSVLAAPDLVRLTLVGAGGGIAAAADARAHIHWSRASGVVISATRLPAAPAGWTYQVWFLGETAVSGGFLTPDADGRASSVSANPSGLPRRVSGMMVTLEPAGGSALPTGTVVLQPAPSSSGN
jgi:hypothetical protein